MQGTVFIARFDDVISVYSINSQIKEPKAYPKHY